MYILVRYECMENGKREIISAEIYDNFAEAKCEMTEAYEKFCKELACRNAFILNSTETECRCDISERGGYNKFYSWEIVKAEQ